jgi:predicted ATPase/serine/threonine protein kinase
MDTTVERIGPYSVRGVIGRGGMGVVRLAHDPLLQRTVAIKSLPAAFTEDPERAARLRREAIVLAQLDHPNIVRIHQLLEQDGVGYLILEHVPGVSLDELLGSGDGPGVTDALRICEQIAAALEAAHASGVVHLDLKPGNVRVRDDGVVKVLDFGLAAVWAEPRDPSTGRASNASGQRHGTPGYMAPEQIVGSRCDVRADIFALGAVLFECLCGARAFTGKSAEEIRRSTLHAEPAWDRLPGELPCGLERMLRGCLQKAPEDRPSSVRDVLDVLTASCNDAEPDGSAPAPSGIIGLPRHRTSFVGRARLLEYTARSVLEHRLVSLVGPGGSGKTRLVEEVAPRLGRSFTGGVYWVELASIRSPEFVPGLVAGVVGAENRADLGAAGAIAERLGGSSVLLLLDNCEHVLVAVSRLIDGLLDACPGLHVLMTSRERLHLQGEQIIPLSGLTTPTEDADPLATRTEAVELFVRRARDASPGFTLDPANADAVASICRRLDGIPLAIEFAASRVRAFSPARIDSLLDDRFRLLVDDGRSGSRFRTIRAALDWSYGMLSPSEQRLFRALSVFAGGWTLEAARALGGEPDASAEAGFDEFALLDLTTGLVDKSLVRVRRAPGSEVRYDMLETVREYAAEKLEDAGEARDAADGHLRWFGGFASRVCGQARATDQTHMLREIEPEHQNILTAISRPWDSPGQVEIAARLCADMLQFWQLRSHFQIGLGACRRLLGDPLLTGRTVERASVLQVAATMCMRLGDLEGIDRYAGEAVGIGRDLEDPRIMAKAHNSLGNSAYFQQNFDEAAAHHTESLRLDRETGNLNGIGASLNNLGNIAHDQGRFGDARAHYLEALETNRRAGNQGSEAVNLYNLGFIAHHLGDLGEARRLYEESLGLREHLEDRFGIAECLGQLARVATEQERMDAACAWHRESLRIRSELGDRLGMCDALEGIAMFAAAIDEHARVPGALASAARIRGEAGAEPSDWERSAVIHGTERSRAALGTETFDAEFRRGRLRATDSVVEDLLRWLREIDRATPPGSSEPTL